MTLQAVNVPETQDRLRVNGSAAVAPVAETRLGGSYAWRCPNAAQVYEVVAPTGINVLSGVGNHISGRVKMVMDATTFTTAAHALLGLETAIETPMGTVVPYINVQIVNGTNKLRLVILDNNGGTTIGASGTTTIVAGTVYDLELRITRTATNDLTGTLRIDGGDTETITLVHTNGLGLGSLSNFRRFIFGVNATLPGDNYDVLYGGVVTLSTSTAGSAFAGWPRDEGDTRALLLLPDGDGTPLDWNASGGGGGVFTEWDDAFGSLSTADWNESGITAGNRDQASSFADPSGIDPIDSFFVVVLGIAGNQPVATDLRAILDDGTAIVKTGYNAAATNTEIIPFIVDSASADWRQHKLNALIGKTRRITGSVVNWRVHAFWMLILYRSAAALNRRRMRHPQDRPFDL